MNCKLKERKEELSESVIKPLCDPCVNPCVPCGKYLNCEEGNERKNPLAFDSYQGCGKYLIAKKNLNRKERKEHAKSAKKNLANLNKTH